MLMISESKCLKWLVKMAEVSVWMSGNEYRRKKLKPSLIHHPLSNHFVVQKKKKSLFRFIILILGPFILDNVLCHDLLCELQLA